MIRHGRLGAVLSLIVLLSLLNLTGCGGCSLITSVPVDVSIAIKDPTFAKLFQCTEELTLSAAGRLQAGKYRVKGVPIDVQGGTEFTLSLKLANNGQSVINLKEATGKFTSTKEIRFHGAPMPTAIELAKGSVSGDIQFIRALGAFLIELVNQQVSPAGQSGSDIAEMVDAIHIQDLVLQLRPGAKLLLPGLSLAIGAGSKLALSDLECDNRWNYSGRCACDLNLEPGSRFYDQGSAIQIDLGAGKATGRLAVSAKDGVSVLHSLNEVDAANEISAQSLTLTAVKGPSKSVVASGPVVINGLDWSLTRAVNKQDARSKVAGKIMLASVAVQMARPDMEAQFSLPAQLRLSFSAEQAPAGNSFHVISPGPLESRAIKLSINRSDGVLSILLDRASLGCDLSSGPDLVRVTLPKGEFEPRKIEWGRDRRRMVMTMPAGTKLSLVRDVVVALNPANRVIEGVIPISFRGGAITIQGEDQLLGLENVSGNLAINIKDQDMNISGKLKTTVTLDGKIAGGVTKCGVSIDSVRITAVPGGVQVSLDGCRIAIPRSVLERAIRSGLPPVKSFSVNKEMLEGSRWRYRNLKVLSATVSHPVLQQFKFSGSDRMVFAGEADVFAQGTVEKSSAAGLLAIATGEGTWSARPWTAKAHVKGLGNVAFQFNPGSSLADSSVSYDAAVNMNVPEQLDLDWSRVADPGDVLARAEKAVVSGALKVAGFCLPEDELSLKRSGTVQLFSKSSQQLRSLKVEKVSARAVGDQIMLEFRSRLNL